MKTTTAAAVAAVLAVLVAAAAFAQETTIKVPQGSGVLPTIGQVNCLEELGTGRLCAATYQCSEGSGRLWGDLANHDGRRAINQDSPVARGRDCTITVDGRAEVRWLTAYAPRGRDSELAGLTTSASALRPVVRGGSTSTVTGEDGGSLLAYILQRHNTTLADIADLVCADYVAGSGRRVSCVDGLLRRIFSPTPGTPATYSAQVNPDGSVTAVAFGRGWSGFADLQENAVTRCLVELYETPHFCTLTTAREFGRQGDCDNRLMAYHLVTRAELFPTFQAFDLNQNYSNSVLYRLKTSAHGQRCAVAAIDKLQQQHGVELIEYEAHTGEGILTLSE